MLTLLHFRKYKQIVDWPPISLKPVYQTKLQLYFLNYIQHSHYDKT